MVRRNKNNLKLVIIDRDGTLNVYREGYIKEPEEWVPVPGALEAISLLNRSGWHVVVASNQPAIGRGVMDAATLHAIHAVMHKQLAAVGGRVEATFFCPHAPEEACTCRKPAPGLFHKIGERYKIDLKQVHAVGNSLSDAQAAHAAGCVPHLVLTGRHAPQADAPLPPDYPAATRVHADLAAFATAFIAEQEALAAATRAQAAEAGGASDPT